MDFINFYSFMTHRMNSVAMKLSEMIAALTDARSQICDKGFVNMRNGKDSHKRHSLVSSSKCENLYNCIEHMNKNAKCFLQQLGTQMSEMVSGTC